MRKTTFVIVVSLTALIVWMYLWTAYCGWSLVFDDAFITYRYARHLAFGQGITWNPGEAPTEGYTNFLLVLLLAPLMRLGADPLLVTRLLSYAAVIASAVIIYLTARNKHDMSWCSSYLAAGIVMVASASPWICLTGLETSLYSAAALCTLLMGVRFIDTRRAADSFFFSLILFLTFLLRPEILLMYPSVLLVYLDGARQKGVPSSLAPPIAGAVALLLLGVSYAVWKMVYFGRLLPNPFYVKAASYGLLSHAGLNSIFKFVVLYAALIFVCCYTAIRVMPKSSNRIRDRQAFRISGLFLAATLLFFARTDTLMDVYGRFLYPLVPIVIYAGLPGWKSIFATVQDRIGGRPALALVAIATYLLVLNPLFILRISGLAGNREWMQHQNLMQCEYRVAQSLASYPGIQGLRIAFADSGVIPYYTQAIWLDTSGLNDSFIAHTREKNWLLDYFFGWNADLIIAPGDCKHTWIRYGHGPLGDYQSWSADRRWDRYMYVGTSRTGDQSYDLHYFVLKTSIHRKAVVSYLRGRVVDGWYEELPLAIGSYVPSSYAKTTWRVRPAPKQSIPRSAASPRYKL